MSENKLMKTLKIGNSPTFEVCDATARKSVNELNSVLGNKVDAINGKSLISDAEISRLSKVFNYDDTLVKESIKELNDKKITKFYASNLGNTTLKDSDNGKITDMKLYGKSFQQTYTGKNLLNTSVSTKTVNGVTIKKMILMVHSH